MTVTLDLRPEIEARLVTQAREEGLPVETYITRVVERLLADAVIDAEEMYVEEEPPVIVPKEVGRIGMRFVSAGRLKALPVDEEDWIDIDA